MQSAVLDGGGANEFGRWVESNKWKWKDIFSILGIKSMEEITDYAEAIKKIKEAKGLN